MRKVFSVLMLAATLSLTAQDKWIDKSESENYVARHECSFTQCGNHFFMFGGREQAQRLDIFDYQSNSWKQGAQAPEELNHFQAVEFDGLIWVVCAFKTNNFPNEVPADYAYIYNPALDLWLQGPSIPNNRARGGAGLVVYNNKFYIIGGNTAGHNGGYVPWVDEYDPLNNTWKKLPDAPRARDHFSAALFNDKIFAVSGRLSGGEGGVFAPLVEETDVFNLENSRWNTLEGKNIPTPRAGASVVVFEKEIFVIGGEGSTPGPAYNIVEAFNPLSGIWTEKAPLNYPRHGTQAIVSGAGIYIAGGSPKRGGGNQHNMEVYKKDAPIGTPIKASVLVAPEVAVFNPFEEKELLIQSKNGNAGNFITSISINGNGFKLKSDLTNQLIKSNTTRSILVQSISEEATTAKLKITYDDNKEVSILIKVE